MKRETECNFILVRPEREKQRTFEQAEWIVDRLKAADVEAELLPMVGSMHGFKGDVEGEGGGGDDFVF